MEEILNCPKCKGIMENGFVVDYTHGGVAKQSVWSKGPIKYDFWNLWIGAVKESLKISSYRCTSCGYLESYAK